MSGAVGELGVQVICQSGVSGMHGAAELRAPSCSIRLSRSGGPGGPGAIVSLLVSLVSSSRQGGSGTTMSRHVEAGASTPW